VTPSRPERRLPHEQLLDASDFDRRRREHYRVLLGEEWARGWLAFETTDEKRRLSAFPQNWSELAESTLEDLCRSAVPVKPAKRINA
jgi:hypothetical protein